MYHIMYTTLVVYMYMYRITGNLAVVLIWRFGPLMVKLKTAKLKFSGGRNVSAVVATPETPN